MRIALGALLNLLWTGAIFVPLERTWRARAQPHARPGWRVDLAFYLGQVLIFTPLAAAALVGCRGPLDSLSLLGPLRAAFSALPWLMQLALALALGDLFAYWGHRAQHAWEPLWRFHAVHHTARHVDWLAAYREHPLDGLYTQALINLPYFVLGVDLHAWAGLITFRGAWAILLHSNSRPPLGPLKWILGSPEFHRMHHALDRDVGHYANLAPYWDLLFGTHGPAGEPERTGIPEPHPEGWLGLLGWSFWRGRAAGAQGAAVEPASAPRR